MTVSAHLSQTPLKEERAYDNLRAHIQRAIEGAEGPLFLVRADDLFSHYVAALPAAMQAFSMCNACRRFINLYGRLVTVDESGTKRSLFWQDSADLGVYRGAVGVLCAMVQNAPIESVFYASEDAYGTHMNYDAKRHVTWTHLAATPPKARRFDHKLMSAAQAVAEKAQDFHLLGRTLEEYSDSALTRALSLLQSGKLFRPEKVIETLKWYIALRKRVLKGRASVLWHAVATAPAGWVHFKNGILGTLLDDTQAGRSEEAIVRSFNEKADPLAYRRTSAAPKAGNIREANRIFEALNLESALNRRFAVRTDVEPHLMWKERQQSAPPAIGGTFGHLAPQSAPPASVESRAARPWTWAKFAREVLPDTLRLEVLIEKLSLPIRYFTAAVDPSCENLFAWDNPARSASYVYSFGTMPEDANLKPGWVSVWGVCGLAHMWDSRWPSPALKHMGEAAILLLEDCYDRSYKRGLTLFPETFRSDLHAVRNTIERHSDSATMPKPGPHNMAGYEINTGTKHAVTVRAHRTDGTALTVKIDRWD